MRVDKGLVESREDFKADVKFKKFFALIIKCIEFVILRKGGVTIEGVESTKSAMSIMS